MFKFSPPQLKSGHVEGRERTLSWLLIQISAIYDSYYLRYQAALESKQTAELELSLYGDVQLSCQRVGQRLPQMLTSCCCCLILSTYLRCWSSLQYGDFPSAAYQYLKAKFGLEAVIARSCMELLTVTEAWRDVRSLLTSQTLPAWPHSLTHLHCRTRLRHILRWRDSPTFLKRVMVKKTLFYSCSCAVLFR